MKTSVLFLLLSLAGSLLGTGCTNDFDTFQFTGGDGSVGGGATGGGSGDASSCAPPTSACASKCVDLQSDPTNCGACGAACAAGLVCVNGQCGCDKSDQCGGNGAECRNDRCRCDGDGCRPGEACRGSGGNATCSCNGGDDCGGGETCCASGCVDLDDSDSNCGACGVQCPSGQECRDGRCRN